MFKLAIVVVLLMAAMCAAEPPRYRSTARRISTLARQEAAAAAPLSPAPTGYPAAGITPAVPFDLPTSTAQPDISYLPPDNTYGPPPQPDEVYGPPDNTYLPPVAEAVPAAEEPEVKDPAQNQEEEEEEEGEEIFVAVADDGSVISVSTAYDDKRGADQPTGSARLVYQRFLQGRRLPALAPARLINRPQLRPVSAQQQQAQSFRFQMW